MQEQWQGYDATMAEQPYLQQMGYYSENAAAQPAEDMFVPRHDEQLPSASAADSGETVVRVAKRAYEVDGPTCEEELFLCDWCNQQGREDITHLVDLHSVDEALAQTMERTTRHILHFNCLFSACACRVRADRVNVRAALEACIKRAAHATYLELVPYYATQEMQ
jgi:hypothetical protein